MSDTTKAAAILEDAADYIDQHGWCQDDYTDLDTSDGPIEAGAQGAPACALGAISIASGQTLWGVRTPAVDTAIWAINQRISTEIVGWNDRIGRTQEEVTAVLRQAAQDLRERAAND